VVVSSGRSQLGSGLNKTQGANLGPAASLDFFGTGTRYVPSQFQCRGWGEVTFPRVAAAALRQPLLRMVTKRTAVQRKRLIRPVPVRQVIPVTAMMRVVHRILTAAKKGPTCSVGPRPHDKLLRRVTRSPRNSCRRKRKHGSSKFCGFVSCLLVMFPVSPPFCASKALIMRRRVQCTANQPVPQTDAHQDRGVGCG